MKIIIHSSILRQDSIIILLCCQLLLILLWTPGTSASEASSSSASASASSNTNRNRNRNSTPRSYPNFSIRLPGKRNYAADWEQDSEKGLLGAGREYSLFDNRGGGAGSPPASSAAAAAAGDTDNDVEDEFLDRYRRSRMARHRLMQQQHQHQRPSSFLNSSRAPKLLQNAQDWWTSSVTPNLEKLPKIVCRIEPTTTLKLRKTFRPLKTIIRVGADFNTQRGVWQFQSSWEDAIIGGKLTLAGKELQLTKSWQLSVGAVEDLVTRLRFRAGINLQTFQAYARVGFRTERLSPINVMEGFTILKRIPLDGSSRGNVKLEVKANVALPEPEIEYSTESQRKTMIGMGDVEVSVDELNLLLDY